MRKKKTNVTICFTKPEDGRGQSRMFQEIIAGGFYNYLKNNGHLRQDAENRQKTEQILEQSRRVCHDINSIDSA